MVPADMIVRPVVDEERTRTEVAQGSRLHSCTNDSGAPPGQLKRLIEVDDFRCRPPQFAIRNRFSTLMDGNMNTPGLRLTQRGIAQTLEFGASQKVADRDDSAIEGWTPADINHAA